MTALALEDVRTLLEAPSPAVLTLMREDGTPLTSPVWYRWTGPTFEVVIAERDPKIGHLRRDPRCTLVIFEAAAPFRGVEVRGEATLTAGDMTDIRRSIAGRYLGTLDGNRFAEARVARPGLLLRLPVAGARVWSLSGILPGAKERAG